MSKFGLPSKTINEILNYFQNKKEIEKVVIYGSRTKNSYHNGSDIDFAVWLKSGLSASQIQSELDDLPTPYKFDVLNYNLLEHEGMKESIDSEGIIFYLK